jgi:hypothetical protein
MYCIDDVNPNDPSIKQTKEDGKKFFEMIQSL